MISAAGSCDPREVLEVGFLERRQRPNPVISASVSRSDRHESPIIREPRETKASEPRECRDSRYQQVCPNPELWGVAATSIGRRVLAALVQCLSSDTRPRRRGATRPLPPRVRRRQPGPWRTGAHSGPGRRAEGSNRASVNSGLGLFFSDPGRWDDSSAIGRP